MQQSYLFSDREVVYIHHVLAKASLNVHTPLQALAHYRKEENAFAVKILSDAFEKMPGCSDMDLRSFILKVKEEISHA